MTEPQHTLADLAVPYALHAVSDQERDDIETRLATVDSDRAGGFYGKNKKKRK